MKMASSGMTRKDMAQMFKKIGWKRKEESAPPPQPSSQPAVSVAGRGVLKLRRIVFRGQVVARECLEDVLDMLTVIRYELCCTCMLFILLRGFSTCKCTCTN